MQDVNVGLGQYSELFILLAGIAYAVAFCAFTWDLVVSSRVTRAVERESEQQSVQVKQAAMAGGGQAPAPERTQPPSAPTAHDSMRYSGVRRPAARVAVAISVIAVVAHAVGVVLRGVASQRVPWGNMYEFCTTGGFIVAAVFLLTLTRRDLRFLGTFVIGLVLVMLFAASSAFYAPVGHLVPALQSYWLMIHVSIAVLSSAIFTLTFAMSLLQLLQGRRQAAMALGKRDPMPFLRLAPSALSLENFSYRFNAVGFVGWTLTLIFGAMWAEKAWGRYWGWDTKEVWTFVVWVVYAGYLHARATRGWSGKRAAWLSIVGYACVVFNFTAVNIAFPGLHSYSGV